MISEAGYKAEAHKVVTADQYILTIYRSTSYHTRVQDGWKRPHSLHAARHGWELDSLVLSKTSQLDLQSICTPGSLLDLTTELQPSDLLSRAMTFGWATSEGTMRAGLQFIPVSGKV